jgi:hypothetical protein
MARLRNDLTGAVMTVEDSTAELLGSEWVPAEEKSEADEAPKARSARSRKTE